MQLFMFHSLTCSFVFVRFVMRALFQRNKYCQADDEMRNIVFNTQYDLKDLSIVDKGKCVDLTYRNGKI